MKLKFPCDGYYFLSVVPAIFLLSMLPGEYHFPVDNSLQAASGKRPHIIASRELIHTPGGNSFSRPNGINSTKNVSASSGTWQVLTPAGQGITGREENTYVAAGNKFYLMGGTGLISTQEYDPKKKTWTNRAKPPIELNHFQGVTLNGLIYAAGAMNGRFPHEVPLPRVYAYNPVSDKWITAATIPASRRRGAAGAVAYKNKIYLIGGITDGHWAGWVKWFDEYDPSTNTWKILPDAPRVRDHFQAVILKDKLYVAGGRRSSAKTGQTFQLTVPEVDIYDFTKGTWSTLPSKSNLPVPRAGASNVVLDNEIIVIGGESGVQTKAHTETHALNVSTNTWRKLAGLNTGRHGTGAIVSNKDIYIASGAGDRGGTPLLNTQENYFISSPTPPTGTSLSQSKLEAPEDLSFGSVQVNSSGSKILTLTNGGNNQDIFISSIALSGSASFSYSSPFPFPFTISPGKSVNITVQFKPVKEGAQTANVMVTHSGQTGSTTSSLSGTGTTADVSQKVTSFTLVNSTTGHDIQTINNGDVLNFSTLGTHNVNIRANTNTETGSVVFVLSGKETRTQTESKKPIALFGDTDGNYNSWTPAAGSYTLKATPYTGSGGTGTAGKSLTINFDVVDSEPRTPPMVISYR